MKFKTNFFRNYLKNAPLPLAVERSMECQILSKRNFVRPILDIGCGDGIFAHTLFAEEVEVGIDPNPKELQHASKCKIYKQLIKCYGDNIPMPSEEFKTIFSNSVLEHIQNIEDVLIEAHRLLASDGVMYITLPTDLFERYTVIYKFLTWIKQEKLAKKYAKFFNRFWRHYHAHKINKWIALFDKCGFRVISSQEYGAKEVCIFNDLLAPFSIFPYIIKKIFNKWFFSPLRAITATFLHKIFQNIANYVETAEEMGGLVFFEICKK